MSFLSPLSVDQLATLTADPSPDTPSAKKCPLTPRSSEACSATGVLPSELLPRPLTDFRQKGTSLRLQERRWQHSEDRRQHSLDMVREARKELIQKAKQARKNKNHGTSTLIRGTTEFDANGPSKSGGKRHRTPSGGDSALELEQKRLARTQARQQAEIEQMLMQEIQRNAIAEQNKRKQDRDEQRQQKIERVRLEKRNAAETIRREREQMRAKDMDEQEQKAKLLQQRMFRENQKQKLKIEQDEIKRRKKNNENEILRRKRQQQLKEETQAILGAQQKKAIAAMEAMNQRDVERKRMLAERRKQQKAVAAEKKLQSQLRIQNAQEHEQRLEQKRFDDYQNKLRLAAERKREEDLHRAREREQQALELKDRRARARHAKEMAAAHLKEKADKVLRQDADFEMRRKQQLKEEQYKLKEEQAALELKRKKKKDAYDNMLRRQEEKVLAIEKHRQGNCLRVPRATVSLLLLFVLFAVLESNKNVAKSSPPLFFFLSMFLFCRTRRNARPARGSVGPDERRKKNRGPIEGGRSKNGERTSQKER